MPAKVAVLLPEPVGHLLPPRPDRIRPASRRTTQASPRTTTSPASIPMHMTDGQPVQTREDGDQPLRVSSVGVEQRGGSPSGEVAALLLSAWVLHEPSTSGRLQSHEHHVRTAQAGSLIQLSR